MFMYFLVICPKCIFLIIRMLSRKGFTYARFFMERDLFEREFLFPPFLFDPFLFL